MKHKLQANYIMYYQSKAGAREGRGSLAADHNVSPGFREKLNG